MMNIVTWEELSTYEQIELSMQMQKLLNLDEVKIEFNNIIKLYKLNISYQCKVEDYVMNLNNPKLYITIEQCLKDEYNKFFDLYFSEGKTSKEIQKILNLDDETTEKYKMQCDGF